MEALLGSKLLDTTRLVTTFLSLSSMRETMKDLRQICTCLESMGCTLLEMDAEKNVHV